jgi:hypothetical protein
MKLLWLYHFIETIIKDPVNLRLGFSDSQLAAK